MNKKLVSGVLFGSFVVFELAEADAHIPIYRVTEPRVSGASETLAEQTHTHSELNLERYVDLTSPSISGGQSDYESYRLHLKPATDSDVVNLIGLPSSGGQMMFGRFDSVDAALQALESTFGLPDVQLQGIRATLLAGTESEVGGHHAALGFQAKALRDLGMTFRPPST